MLVKLSWEERNTAGKVAKLFSNIALNNMEFGDRGNSFWFISIKVRSGFLKKQDYHNLIVAMESLGEMRIDHPELDPENTFANVSEIARKLKSNPGYQKYLAEMNK